MFRAACKWDCSSNSVRFYHKLSDDHMYLYNAQKMRNHLAIEVLDASMLQFMKEYQANVSEKSKLDGVVQLLEQTSPTVKFFPQQATMEVIQR